LKEDNIKYTVCTEGSDSNFHYLRVMLISLLKHNPWADKDITIFTCDETPLSRHNRTILESICKNIKFHDIDPNIYASLNIKGAIRKSILPLLYKIEAFNLTENDVVLYVNSSSLCISSLDFVFSGKSEAMVANTGYISQDKRNPDPRKLKVDESNTSLLLLSKSVLSENMSPHIIDRLSRIKNLTDKVIEKEIIDSLKIRQIEIGYFDLNRVIKKSRYTDSKYNNFLSIKKNVGLIQLDINFSRKNDSSRLMYRKIDAIWQSYNQQGEWNTLDYSNHEGSKIVHEYTRKKEVLLGIPNYLENIKNKKTSSIFTKHNIIKLNEFKKYIYGKKICLVANSSDLLKDDLGSFIDSHDIVVRFNSYEIDEKHTGKKTNIHASIYLSNYNLEHIVDYRLIVSINRNNWIKAIREKLDPSNQIAIIDSNWPISLSSKLEHKKIIATTGFNAIKLFYKLGGYKELNLVAFNFYSTGTSSVYRKKEIGPNISKVHNYKLEKKWVNKNFKKHSKFVMTHVNSSI